MTITRRALAPGEVDHERVWLAVGLGLALAGAAVHAGLATVLPCPLKTATGWPCLGCGSTRALVALCHGSVAAAFRANPLATLVGLGWTSWAVYAMVAIAGGTRRLRVAASPRDLAAARWIATLAVTATWAFLVLDGR